MDVVLYQFEECPYCAKVRAALDDLKIPYKKVNVPRDRTDSLRKMLLEKSGVATVPIAQIGGEFVGESSIIIERLRSLRGKGAAAN